MVLSNYRSLNPGKKKKKNSQITYTDKSYGLKSYDDRACRKIDRFENIEQWQKGLFVENGKIYFKYDDLREFRRIIRKSTFERDGFDFFKSLFNASNDGIAVDIIQKNQYECGNHNLINNNLPNRGYLLKPWWASKIYRKNLVDKERPRSLLIELDELPQGISDDYELNLVLIQDNHVCKSIPQNFII